MALRPLQARDPIGTFDGLDAEVTSFLGGEVVGFTTVSITGSDKHAKDIEDGYAGTTSKVYPAVTLTLTSGMRPLFLADEGIAHYGTMFGTLVGASVGKVVSGGTVLGPHTAEGSGKITIWGQPGLYGVTLDAVDTTASTGLTPTNTTLTVNAALYATTAGLLTPDAGSAFEAVVVGRFIEFGTDFGLVTTPVNLASAANSPSGSTAQVADFTQALVYFNGANVA